MARRKRINSKKRHPSAYKHITQKDLIEQSLTEATKRKIHPTMAKGKDALQLF